MAANVFLISLLKFINEPADLMDVRKELLLFF